MTLDKLLVLLTSGGLVGFIYWFFLDKKDKNIKVDKSVNITVSGGYAPASITIAVGKPTDLIFTRTDPSGCLEEVVLPDFSVKKTLPLNQPVTISITPAKAGEYSFHCGMNMYSGKIIAKN